MQEKLKRCIADALATAAAAAPAFFSATSATLTAVTGTA
jgi:hypothetical protein